MKEQKVDRLSVTRRFLDKRRDPQEYVDEELPTTTLKLKGALRRVSTRAPIGTVAEGSYRVTGSHYDFSPGTYSLRVIRLSLAAVGSPSSSRGTVYQWHIRHSRQGTVDVQVLQVSGAQSGRVTGDRVDLRGGPHNPVYAFGPGTVFWGWDTFKGELGTRVTLTQSMEAIAG